MLGVFVLLGGVQVTLPPTEHDAFEWWAEIWIPSLVGLTTVVVSAVALIVSRNASVLARKVEEQRVAAETERHQDEQRSRLQSLALEDARKLQLWVVEHLNYRVVFHPIGEPIPPRSEHDQARIDAEVAFAQSIVPGAGSVFALTAFDLKSRRKFLAEPREETPQEKAVRASFTKRRDQRTRDRIRSWALDPIGQAPVIESEWVLAQTHEVDYLMFGEEPISAG